MDMQFSIFLWKFTEKRNNKILVVTSGQAVVTTMTIRGATCDYKDAIITTLVFGWPPDHWLSSWFRATFISQNYI